jgi:hypothetical protein
MFFREVLQFVVVKIATMANDGEDDHLPIIKAWPSDIASGIWVQIIRNQATKFGPELGLREEMLQGR